MSAIPTGATRALILVGFALTAVSLAAPAQAFKGSKPNPVLKCLGADCNNVAWERRKQRGPNHIPCAEEVYTENGIVMKPINPKYCATY